MFLIQPESRQAFAWLLAQGWTDALRKLHHDGPLWTFWDYKRERRPKDKKPNQDINGVRRLAVVMGEQFR